MEEGENKLVIDLDELIQKSGAAGASRVKKAALDGMEAFSRVCGEFSDVLRQYREFNDRLSGECEKLKAKNEELSQSSELGLLRELSAPAAEFLNCFCGPEPVLPGGEEAVARFFEMFSGLGIDIVYYKNGAELPESVGMDSEKEGKLATPENHMHVHKCRAVSFFRDGECIVRGKVSIYHCDGVRASSGKAEKPGKKCGRDVPEDVAAADENNDAVRSSSAEPETRDELRDEAPGGKTDEMRGDTARSYPELPFVNGRDFVIKKDMFGTVTVLDVGNNGMIRSLFPTCTTNKVTLGKRVVGTVWKLRLDDGSRVPIYGYTFSVERYGERNMLVLAIEWERGEEEQVFQLAWL